MITMQSFLETLYPWLIAAIGGFIGAALLLPTKLGEAVIQYRVGKTLEAFKAEQAHELEKVRAELNHVGDRGRRSNEMEFQSIQIVWDAFVKAWLSTNTCIAQMIRVPDFDRMDDTEIELFATGSGWSDDDAVALLKATDKQKQFTSTVSWKAVTQAGTDVYDARLTLRKQRIFMPPTLTDEFSEAIEAMSGAQVQRRLSLENPNIPDYRYGKAQCRFSMTLLRASIGAYSMLNVQTDKVMLKGPIRRLSASRRYLKIRGPLI